MPILKHQMLAKPAVLGSTVGFPPSVMRLSGLIPACLTSLVTSVTPQNQVFLLLTSTKPGHSLHTLITSVTSPLSFFHLVLLSSFLTSVFLLSLVLNCLTFSHHFFYPTWVAHSHDHINWPHQCQWLHNLWNWFHASYSLTTPSVPSHHTYQPIFHFMVPFIPLTLPPR